jgi:hypothetical protein
MNPTTQSAIATITALDTENASLRKQLANPPITLSGLEYAPDWRFPGNAGNTGGPSAAPHGSLTWGTMPAPNGWWISQLKGAIPYDTFYCFRKSFNSDMNPYTRFRYSFDIFYSTATDIAGAQAFEWELQKCIGGYVYNMAFQIDFKDSKKIRYFKYVLPLSNAAWIATEIPVDFSVFTAGKAISLASNFLLDHTEHTTTHVSVEIAGKSYNIGVTQPAWNSGDPDYFSHAIQDDCGANFEPFNRGIRNMRVDLAQ